MACGDSNDFIIPKGLAFDFTVQVLQDNSFLPQPLDAFQSGTLTLIDIDTGALVTGVAAIPLSKLAEEVIPAVALVMEETDLSIAVGAQVIYTITINGTVYTVDMTANGVNPTLAEVATAFGTAMAVLPENVTVSVLGGVITIKNTVGQINTITYSTNIAKTRYVAGTEAVAGYTSTAYNDSGYLKGTIPALDTAKLTVKRGDVSDGYYLKPAYQGVLQVLFSDTTPSKTALICEIYVINTGN